MKIEFTPSDFDLKDRTLSQKLHEIGDTLLVKFTMVEDDEPRLAVARTYKTANSWLTIIDGRFYYDYSGKILGYTTIEF